MAPKAQSHTSIDDSQERSSEKINLNDTSKSVKPRNVRHSRTKKASVDVKLCAIFKPFLRRFRAFIRQKFDAGRSYSTYQHWNNNKYQQQVRKFMMQDLSMPEDLTD